MGVWGIVLLSFDLALMGAILYILLSRKNRKPGIMMTIEQEPERRPGDASPSILSELKEELERVKRTAAELDRKKSAFAVIERSLHEKMRKLDETIKKADGPARDLAISGSGVTDDTYSGAMKMLRTGVPAEEAVKNLVILNGEAEPIPALNDYKN